MNSKSFPVHPADELLIAYLTAGLEEAERAAVRAHLADCDRCIGELVVARSRLDLGGEIAVPSSVIARAAWSPSDRRTSDEPGATPTWGARLRDWFEVFTRLPVLAPASFAAGVLLMLGIYPGAYTAPVATEMMRSVDSALDLKVRVNEALMREQPKASAAVVGRVRRGQVVTIAAEAAGWYQVRLAGGVSGWVERRAFE